MNAKDHLGNTALTRAVENGTIDVIKELLAAGTNIHAKDSNGMTALSIAIEKGQKEAEQILRKSEATLPPKAELALAAEAGDIIKVKELIKNGADCNEKWRGDSILHYAVSKGKLEIVRVLLEAGANTEITDESGWTPLIVAAGEGHMDVVQEFIDRGANVNFTDHYGMTALWWARLMMHNKIADILIKAGAKETKLCPDEKEECPWSGMESSLKALDSLHE